MTRTHARATFGAAMTVVGLLLTVPGAGPAAARGSLQPEPGRFLVASAAMADPRFRHTVVLLVRYGADGALGLVVNRETDLSLARAFPDVEEMQGVTHRLWLGGPVDQGRPAVLVEADSPPPDSIEVLRALHFSRSMVLMRALAPERGRRFRVYAGYAGWAAGQLDAELSRAAWRVIPATVDEVFSADGESLWRTLDAATAGTWVRRGEVPTPRLERPRNVAGRQTAVARVAGVPAACSVVFPRDLDAGQFAVVADRHAQHHGAAAHGAVLDQLGVSRRAVQRHRVADPAPGADDVSMLEHVR